MQNPNYKNGIKNLTEKQMKTSLPAYKMMIDKIKRTREEASLINKAALLENDFETMKYDQIFSLLGGRGAGKTSMLLTIYNELKTNDENILLPIIMPELIDEDEDILSWLLSAMKINLNEIEANILDLGHENKSDKYKQMLTEYNFFERCTFNNNNLLRKKYETLRRNYYTRNYNYTGDNYTETRELRASSVDSSFQLMRLFIDYWNCLLDVYSNCINTNISDGSKKKKPLIFIFIDDADLKPQIFNELIFVIPKYLSHPNVIVYVSASPKTLSYAVKNYMFKSLTQHEFDLTALMDIEYQYNSEGYDSSSENILRFKELRYGREYDKIVKLSDEILRKLFPAYNRLYLKKYDRYEDKGLLQMFENDSCECQKTIPFSEKIFILLNSFYNDIMELHNMGIRVEVSYKMEPEADTLEQKKKSFSLISDDHLNNIFSLSFVGKYPRDITSVYFAMKDMLSELKICLAELYDSNKDGKVESISSVFLDSVYESIKKFLNTTIMCNNKLRMFSGKIEKLLEKQLLHWQMFINYAGVLDVFRAPGYISHNKKEPDAFVEMMCLLNFAEQIIVLVMPQRRTVHGKNEFCELLDLIGIDVVKPTDKLDDMFNQYLTFHSLDIIPEFHIDRIGDQNHFLYGVDNLKLFNEAQRDFKRNKKWYDIYTRVYLKKYSWFRYLHEYSDDLIIFHNFDFLDHAYYELSNNYYSDLKNIIVNEEVKPFNKSDIIRMEEYIMRLDSAIGQLNLFVNKPEKKEYGEDDIDFLQQLYSSLEAFTYPGMGNILKEISKLIDYITRNKIFRRDILLSRLDTIKKMTEEYKGFGISIRDRYKVFENILRKYIKVYEDDETYLQYINLICQIESIYSNYIYYYVNEINDKFIRDYGKSYERNKKSMYKKLRFSIENAREQEWNEILKMVDDFEKK